MWESRRCDRGDLSCMVVIVVVVVVVINTPRALSCNWLDDSFGVVWLQDLWHWNRKKEGRKRVGLCFQDGVLD